MPVTSGVRVRAFGRWPLAVSVAAIAVGILAYSASASFSTMATAPHPTDTGRMELAIGAAGEPGNRLTIGAAFLPGGEVERQVTLTVGNDGGTMSAVALSTSATNGPPSFVADASDGLELWIAACSVAWAETGTAPDLGYTCGGSQADVLGTSSAPVPVLQTAVPLANLALGDGAENHLRVRLSLPPDAPASMANQASDITFSFEGVARSPSGR